MSTKKPNILFVGHFGALNLGDELLLLSEIDMLNNVFENGINPFVYSYKPKTAYYDNYGFDITQIQAFSLRKFIKSITQIYSCIKKVDIIIIGGGGIIQDKYFVYRPLSTLLPALLGFMLNKPVYGFSLGIYKINLPINKKIFQAFIKYSQAITYRDKTSYINIQKNGNLKEVHNNEIYLIPDSALAIPVDKLITNIETNTPSPYMVITIREVFEDYIDDLIYLIEAQAANHQINSLKLIAFEDIPEEYNILSLLKLKLSSSLTIEIIKFPNLIDYLNLLKNSNLILAGRLHGCIPSYVLNKKIIGLAYEEKVSDFCLAHNIPFSYINNLKEIIYNNDASPNSLAIEINELNTFALKIKNTYQNISKTTLFSKLKLFILLIRVFTINLIIHFFKINYKKKI